MTPQRPWTLESLEARETPAAFGIPWLNAQNVTLSFAADGTQVDGAASNLFASLSANGVSAATFQAEALRAVQTWAAQANLNVGVVAETASSSSTGAGYATATSGRSQGDPRFGDIRVLARPLVGTVLAVTTPAGIFAETRGGDIVLNTNYKFSVGGAAGTYDIYSTLLQEVGHALGLGNSPSTSSVMYETYRGVRAALNSNDISSIQSLYGTRPKDAFEGANGSGSRSYASTLPATAGTSTLFARADVRNSGDSDYFKFTTPGSLPNGVTLKLTAAGVSLLKATLQVQNSSGTVVASGQAADPGAGSGDITLALTNLSPNTTYYAVVKSATNTVFSAGGYKLSAAFDPAAANPDPQAVAPVYVSDSGTNETRTTATALTAVPGATAQAAFQAFGKFSSSSDVDYYKVKAPTLAAGTKTTITIALRANSFGGAAFANLYDAAGTALAPENISATSGLNRVYQLRNVAGSTDYYVSVYKGSLFTASEYELNVAFRTRGVEFEQIGTGQLDRDNDTVSIDLQVNQTQIISQSLTLESLGNKPPLYANMNIYDSAGKLVVQAIGTILETSSTVALLQPGTYTIKLSATAFGSDWTPVKFTYRLANLTDPIGAEADNGTGTQPPFDVSYNPGSFTEFVNPVQ